VSQQESEVKNMKIIKGICIVTMCIAFLLILGAAGGLEKGTMGMADTSVYCFIGFIVIGIGAIIYNKIDMKGDR
jgi:hypothetical protein